MCLALAHPNALSKISGSCLICKDQRQRRTENVENWKGSISHAFLVVERPHKAVLKTQYSWQCICVVSIMTVEPVIYCWKFLKPQKSCRLLIHLVMSSKNDMCTFQAPNSLWIRLKGKTWHYYNHYIHSPDLPTELVLKVPFFSKANERSAVAGSSPAQVFQWFKESETAESEVCLGKFHAYIFIFVYMHISRHIWCEKPWHSSLTLTLPFIKPPIYIYIIYTLYTFWHTPNYTVSFSDAKRKRDHDAFSNVVPQKLQRHPPQAAPPPASTLHCASPPSVARHPCKSHSSTTVTTHPCSKTIPVWSPGYPMYILQDVYTMCSGPVLRKKNWNQNRQPKNAKKKSELIWWFEKKEIPASSSTPFQTQNFHVQQMSPLQRLPPLTKSI